MTTHLSPEAKAEAIKAIEAVIAEIEREAQGILECVRSRFVGDPQDCEHYERLITVTKRARCALTLLSAAVAQL